DRPPIGRGTRAGVMAAGTRPVAGGGVPPGCAQALTTRHVGYRTDQRLCARRCGPTMAPPVTLASKTADASGIIVAPGDRQAKGEFRIGMVHAGARRSAFVLNERDQLAPRAAVDAR